MKKKNKKRIEKNPRVGKQRKFTKHPRRFPCNHCYMLFTRSSHVKQHVIKIHEKWTNNVLVENPEELSPFPINQPSVSSWSSPEGVLLEPNYNNSDNFATIRDQSIFQTLSEGGVGNGSVKLNPPGHHRREERECSHGDKTFENSLILMSDGGFGGNGIMYTETLTVSQVSQGSQLVLTNGNDSYATSVSFISF